MSNEEFMSIRWNVIIFCIAAIVVALDVFVWRP
jgi:hypothetical protein